MELTPALAELQQKLMQRKKQMEALFSDEMTLLEAQTYLYSTVRIFKENPKSPFYEDLVEANAVYRAAVEHITERTREDKTLMYKRLRTQMRAGAREHNLHMYRELPGMSYKASEAALRNKYVLLRIKNAERAARHETYFTWVIRSHQFAPHFYCLPAIAADAVWVRVQGQMPRGGDPRTLYRRLDAHPTPGVLETLAKLYNPASENYFSVSKAYEAALRL